MLSSGLGLKVEFTELITARVEVFKSRAQKIKKYFVLQENETKRLKEEGDKIMKTISKGQADMKTFQTQVENKINVLSNELGDIKKHIEDKTGEIDASIEAMHVSFKDRFEAERTETARETEAMKKQFKGNVELLLTL